MLALTIHQPWAWAIAHDEKRIENREWAPPRDVIGKFIAIHAGARPRTKKAWEEMGQLSEQIGGPGMADLAFGAVVAVARLVRCRDFAPGPQDPQFLWWVGPLGWELDQVFALPVPVEAKGKQKLWALEPGAERNIRLQWKAAHGHRLTYAEAERLALQDPATH